MSKQRITLEVDNVKLFDCLHKVNGNTNGIGASVICALLAPKDTSYSTKMQMAVYGVVVEKVEDIEDD